MRSQRIIDPYSIGMLTSDKITPIDMGGKFLYIQRAIPIFDPQILVEKEDDTPISIIDGQSIDFDEPANRFFLKTLKLYSEPYASPVITSIAINSQMRINNFAKMNSIDPAIKTFEVRKTYPRQASTLLQGGYVLQNNRKNFDSISFEVNTTNHMGIGGNYERIELYASTQGSSVYASYLHTDRRRTSNDYFEVPTELLFADSFTFIMSSANQAGADAAATQANATLSIKMSIKYRNE